MLILPSTDLEINFCIFKYRILAGFNKLKSWAENYSLAYQIHGCYGEVFLQKYFCNVIGVSIFATQTNRVYKCPGSV